MISGTIAQSQARGNLVAMVVAALIGAGIVFLAGHVQASALHAAAHDVRHATGFPCH